MIKAHPTDPMLRAFAADELPLPLAVGLSAHCELCPDCAARLKTFEEELAQQYLASPAEPELDSRDEAGLDAGFDAMLADILAQPLAEPLSEPTHDQPRAQPGELEVAGHAYRLPRVLARYRSPKWRHIGAIRQQSLPLDEMGARASLLHIEAGGRIPEHTHQGYELTLLLAGNIQDGDTLYKAGISSGAMPATPTARIRRTVVSATRCRMRRCSLPRGCRGC